MASSLPITTEVRYTNSGGANRETYWGRSFLPRSVGKGWDHTMLQYKSSVFLPLSYPRRAMHYWLGGGILPRSGCYLRLFYQGEGFPLPIRSRVPISYNECQVRRLFRRDSISQVQCTTQALTQKGARKCGRTSVHRKVWGQGSRFLPNS